MTAVQFYGDHSQDIGWSPFLLEFRTVFMAIIGSKNGAQTPVPGCPQGFLMEPGGDTWFSNHKVKSS